MAWVLQKSRGTRKASVKIFPDFPEIAFLQLLDFVVPEKMPFTARPEIIAKNLRTIS
jgi:hypothetical protein